MSGIEAATMETAAVTVPGLVEDKEILHHQQHDQHDADQHDAHHHQGGNSFKSLIAGAVGGTAEVLTDHPIDTCKVRLQTCQSLSATSTTTKSVGGSAFTATSNGLLGKPTAATNNKTVLSILHDIVKTDGLVGLYRGASIRVATLMPATAISFWGLDIGKQLVREIDNKYYHYHYPHHHLHHHGRRKQPPLSITQVTCAGAFAGIPVTLFATPSERIKCLLQIQENAASAGGATTAATTTTTHYRGPIHCGMTLFRQGGWNSLYRGLNITLLRNVPGYATWFGVYEICKRQFAEPSSISAIILSGGIAGSVSWGVMIPFDGLKSRIQTHTDLTPKTIATAYRELTRIHGPRALFRGLGPATLIAFPANAACFLGMELAYEALSVWD